MKKVGLLFLGLALAVSSFAQSDTTKHKKGIFWGKTPYVSGSILSSASPFSYSVEAGMWGTASMTSFGLTADFIRNGSCETSHFVGIKLYQTFYQTSKSCYMVYIAPKTNINYGQKTNPMNTIENIVEIGLNPNFEVNRHLLLSVSFATQIYNDNNQFHKSLWHPCTSIGVVLFK